MMEEINKMIKIEWLIYIYNYSIYRDPNLPVAGIIPYQFTDTAQLYVSHEFGPRFSKN